MHTWIDNMTPQTGLLVLAVFIAITIAILIYGLMRLKKEREAIAELIDRSQNVLLERIAAEQQQNTRRLLSEENTHLRMELGQRLQSLSNSQSEQLMKFSQMVQNMNDASGKNTTAIRQEMNTNLANLTASNKNELAEVRQAMNTQIEAMRQKQEEKLDQLTRSQREQLMKFSQMVQQMNDASGKSTTAIRQEMSANLANLTASNKNELSEVRQAMNNQIEAMRQNQEEKLDQLAKSQTDQLMKFSQMVQQMNDASGKSSTAMRQEMTNNLNTLTNSIKNELNEVRQTMNTQIDTMRNNNEKKLEQMRLTVEEKLQSTLETRLSESFKQVAAQLKEVETGLGEMRSLAGQVGELKRVLTNVKTRGTFGETQLGAILEDILTPDQYEANVITRLGGSEQVEFAVKMPGPSENSHVWLPIDAKFPIEDWQRLEDARIANDLEAIDMNGKALENRLKAEAKKIREKYVEVPYTTDFAVLFLPSEALYAECLRRQGLAEHLQSTYRITVAGPTVLAALLNSLRMGFRTLAIQKRSDEVWEILGRVKGEFEKFTKVIDQIERQVNTVKNSIGTIRTRTKVMNQKLRHVESLPGETTPLIEAVIDNSGEGEEN